MKMGSLMPNMEKLLSRMSIERVGEQNEQNWMSKIDPEYAYCQVKLSDGTSRLCNFAIIGRNMNGHSIFKTGILLSPRHPEKALQKRPNFKLPNTCVAI